MLSPNPDREFLNNSLKNSERSMRKIETQEKIIIVFFKRHHGMIEKFL